MICQENLLSAKNSRPTPFLCRTWVILLLIILLAAFLRLVRFGQSPPGINQDEAVNAWNAYCLLKTGKDQTDAPWPIFYTRGIGGNWSTLYIYLLIPFQAIGGLNITTTRLPSAVLGIFTVVLIYFVGKRLFSRTVGLVAAGLLTLNPWHFQQSRWGHEASITPLLGLAPLALMLWANIIPANGENKHPRPLVAAMAGIITGICCYGYQAVRIFTPVFLLFIVLLMFPHLLQGLKTRKGILSATVFLITFLALFAPLAWQHIFHPEGIGRHFLFQQHRIGSDGLYESLKNIFIRYIQHFSPGFLFTQGDQYQMEVSPNAGKYHWYMLPLMMAGLITSFKKFKSSFSVRVILVFAITYPIGDCLVWQQQLSTLRSAPGLCSLVLLAALGTVDSFNWLWKRNRITTISISAAFIIVLISLNIRYFYNFFGRFTRQPETYHAFHTDLVEACDWLRPCFDDFDAVVCSHIGMTGIISLVALHYDPNRWFSEPRELITEDEWDYQTRYGKMYFMYHEKLITPLAEQFRAGRVLLIIRPGEIDIPDPQRQIIHKISRPDGTVTLWLCRI